MAIDKSDLKEMKKDITDHIDARLKPVTEDIVNMRLTLYGAEGRNGLAGDMRDVKNSARIFKWIAGGGFGGAAAAWFKEFLR